jgi:hypothetical protein
MTSVSARTRLRRWARHLPRHLGRGYGASSSRRTAPASSAAAAAVPFGYGTSGSRLACRSGRYTTTPSGLCKAAIISTSCTLVAAMAGCAPPFWLCLSINVGNKWGWSCSAVRLWDLGQQACVLKWSLHDKSVWAVHGSDNLMSCV